MHIILILIWDICYCDSQYSMDDVVFSTAVKLWLYSIIQDIHDLIFFPVSCMYYMYMCALLSSMGILYIRLV